MFGRRTKKTIPAQIREMLWPSMGWRRGVRYVVARLLRLRDSDHAIARGLAFGVSISFAPAPGTHIAGAALLSWLTRGNVFASFIGTLFGNPWTIPFMWWGAYEIGKRTFHLLDLPVREFPAHFQWGELMQELSTDPMGLFVPWLCGGIILGFIMWPVFYVAFFVIVRQARSRLVLHKKHHAKRGHER